MAEEMNVFFLQKLAVVSIYVLILIFIIYIFLLLSHQKIAKAYILFNYVHFFVYCLIDLINFHHLKREYKYL